MEIPPQLLLYLPVAAYVFQGLRMVKWFEEHKDWILPINLVVGIGFAFLAMPDATGWKQTVLAGLLFAVGASGFHHVDKRVGISRLINGDSAKKLPCLFLAMSLLFVAGCKGVILSPTYSQLVRNQAYAMERYAQDAEKEPPCEGEDCPCHIGAIPCSVVPTILKASAESWQLLYDASKGIDSTKGDDN